MLRECVTLVLALSVPPRRRLVSFILSSVILGIISIFWYFPPFEYCIGVGIGLFLIVFTALLFDVNVSQSLREPKRSTRALCPLILLVIGTSCILLLIAYSILFPPNLRYLESLGFSIWETSGPIFSLRVEPVWLFLFIFGGATSSLSFSSVLLLRKTPDYRRSLDHRVFMDFGLALLTVGTLLPISTALFNPFVWSSSGAPQTPLGVWVFPYLSQGILLDAVSFLFMAMTGILGGWESFLKYASVLRKTAIFLLLPLSWLILAYISSFEAFGYLMLVTRFLSCFSFFIVIYALSKVCVHYAHSGYSTCGKGLTDLCARISGPQSYRAWKPRAHVWLDVRLKENMTEIWPSKSPWTT